MDEIFMQRALQLAAKSRGKTSPNPMVGAVIVNNGQIVGEGWHQAAGTPHAEIHALCQAGHLAKNATLYVTLEPCCHYGRTGPCSDAIITAGIKKVIVAMTDPNPVVAGKGISILRANAIEVVEGVLSHEAAKLNEVFIKWITTKMPFGVLKTAMTLDGKIAAFTGHSKWITGEQARDYGHRLRNIYDAILVGIGTVLADDPALTTRIPGGKNPLRVVVDSMARIPLTAKLLNDNQAPVVIAVSPNASEEKLAALRSKHADIVIVPCGPRGGIDLRGLFEILGRRSITSIFIEGGSRINASAISAGLIDKAYWFIAPKFIGGSNAPGPIGGTGLETMEKALTLEDIELERVGEDILITAYLQGREGRHVYRTCGRTGNDKSNC
ncbi:Riboflavin biosynthesis protein RibD [Propionispora sp. 2/2-37]|uniref:bifunctional diaminohydroxyphosphoribosylaminopyrimidine deaminase/5-amino-6-(5-phosphoribosylamino)uracil reductase RibD n=1 Tax=Propionispora sp. 2/2-37 TaxID=1677858 RepID=UPI0006BB8050|nr:bifunctional diaminohydroxyphosphoribosylaminopyrimidine deaminase/5-amino-6-(5-phosphoribosylamino)uracil reductase RibD [Propionispora sp. 2/2-37]CUH94224.1 Riboflavin biosynthesis protein RibD [Propionispora sp. 2/2-37]